MITLSRPFRFRFLKSGLSEFSDRLDCRQSLRPCQKQRQLFCALREKSFGAMQAKVMLFVTVSDRQASHAGLDPVASVVAALMRAVGCREFHGDKDRFRSRHIPSAPHPNRLGARNYTRQHPNALHITQQLMAITQILAVPFRRCQGSESAFMKRSPVRH